MPSMNWDDFIESSGEAETPPPANTYLAVVETAEWTTTKKAPPRPILKCRLRIEAGPEKGKALFTQVMVDPDAQPFAKRRSLEQLNALGLSNSDLKNLSDGEQADQVVGAVVEVETSIDDKYDPQNPRARVDSIKAAQGAPSTASAAPPKKEKAPSKKKAADKPSTPPPAAPFDDDDD